jgi:hypothetical protein
MCELKYTSSNIHEVVTYYLNEVYLWWNAWSKLSADYQKENEIEYPHGLKIKIDLKQN